MKQQIVWIVTALVGALLCALPAHAQDNLPTSSDQPWYDNADQALAAAGQSHKPIYFLVYIPGDRDCEYMWQQVLIEPSVLSELGKFELCRLNSQLLANHAFLLSKNIALPEKVEGEEKPTFFAAVSASFFSDWRGEQILRAPVYLEPKDLVSMLRQVASINDALLRINLNEKDAVAHAAAGHVFMQLCAYDESRTHLEKAVELDPDGKLGARADAELDLLILSIPTDEDKQVEQGNKVYDQLVTYQRAHPNSSRDRQVRFFMAVCQYAARQPKKALEILDYFYGTGKPKEFNEDTWTGMALGMRNQIRLELGLPDDSAGQPGS